MVTTQILDSLPIWLLFIITTMLFLLAFEAGRRSGKAIQQRWPDQTEPSVVAKVGASLTILALLLAFVINYAINTFTEKRHLVVNEANVIGTAYLRAGYLPEPYGTESRQLLSDYLDLRLEVVDPVKSHAVVFQSEQIHNQLWVYAEQLAREYPSPVISLYISAINDLIDIHTERLNSEIGFRVPITFTLGLLGISIMVMFLIGISDGYHERNNRLVLIVLVVMLSLVFLLFVGLDRSNTGLVRVSLDPLIDLQQKLSTLP